MAIGGLGGAKERDSCGMSTYRECCWEKYCRSQASRLGWELSPLPTIVIQPRRVSASQHIEAPPHPHPPPPAETDGTYDVCSLPLPFHLFPHVRRDRQKKEDVTHTDTDTLMMLSDRRWGRGGEGALNTLPLVFAGARS